MVARGTSSSPATSILLNPTTSDDLQRPPTIGVVEAGELVWLMREVVVREGRGEGVEGK